MQNKEQLKQAAWSKLGGDKSANISGRVLGTTGGAVLGAGAGGALGTLLQGVINKMKGEDFSHKLTTHGAAGMGTVLGAVTGGRMGYQSGAKDDKVSAEKEEEEEFEENSKEAAWSKLGQNKQSDFAGKATGTLGGGLAGAKLGGKAGLGLGALLGMGIGSNLRDEHGEPGGIYGGAAGGMVGGGAGGILGVLLGGALGARSGYKAGDLVDDQHQKLRAERKEAKQQKREAKNKAREEESEEQDKEANAKNLQTNNHMKNTEQSKEAAWSKLGGSKSAGLGGGLGGGLLGMIGGGALGAGAGSMIGGANALDEVGKKTYFTTGAADAARNKIQVGTTSGMMKGLGGGSVLGALLGAYMGHTSEENNDDRAVEVLKQLNSGDQYEEEEFEENSKEAAWSKLGQNKEATAAIKSFLGATKNVGKSALGGAMRRTSFGNKSFAHKGKLMQMSGNQGLKASGHAKTLDATKKYNKYMTDNKNNVRIAGGLLGGYGVGNSIGTSRGMERGLDEGFGQGRDATAKYMAPMISEATQQQDLWSRIKAVFAPQNRQIQGNDLLDFVNSKSDEIKSSYQA